MVAIIPEKAETPLFSPISKLAVKLWSLSCGPIKKGQGLTVNNMFLSRLPAPTPSLAVTILGAARPIWASLTRPPL